MTAPARYIKVVQSADEGLAFERHFPGVNAPCCRGPYEGEVARRLCGIVDE